MIFSIFWRSAALIFLNRFNPTLHTYSFSVLPETHILFLFLTYVDATYF